MLYSIQEDFGTTSDNGPNVDHLPVRRAVVLHSRLIPV